jgi:hypothetical protein
VPFSLLRLLREGVRRLQASSWARSRPSVEAGMREQDVAALGRPCGAPAEPMVFE